METGRFKISKFPAHRKIDRLQRRIKAAWRLYSKGEFSKAANIFNRHESDAQILENPMLVNYYYGQGLSLLQLGDENLNRGIASLLKSCETSFNEEESKEGFEGLANSFGKIQYTLAYQDLTGFLGFSPHDIFNFLFKREYKSPQDNILRELVESKIMIEHSITDERLPRIAIETIEKHYAKNYMSRHALFYIQGLDILHRAVSAREVLQGLEFVFCSLFEHNRFAAGNYDLMQSLAGGTLLSRFHANVEFIQSVSNLVVKEISERAEHAPDDDEMSVFRRAAYFRGNPHRYYINFLRSPKVRDGVIVKAGMEPIVNSVLRDEIREKTEKLSDLDRIVKDNSERLKKYLREERKADKLDNQLVILKKWNSCTPRNPEDENGSEGGGFLIVWNGKGIAIDPGYDFLKNLATIECTVNDIDLIIVSHAHDDHTADIEPIYSLAYKAGKERREQRQGISIFGSEGSQIKFGHAARNSQGVAITLGEKSNRISVNKRLATFDIGVEWCRALHDEMPWLQGTSGISFVIKLGKPIRFRIGFTGDTRFSKRVCDLLSDVDVLVVNLGSHEKHPGNHLGISGVIKTICRSRPKLVLVTEFGRELESVRDVITSSLTDDTHVMCPHVFGNPLIAVLPTDVGFHVILKEPEILVMARGLNRPVSPQSISYFDSIKDGNLVFRLRN